MLERIASHWPAPTHLIIALAAATAVALAARRARTLSAGGAVAAAVVGTLVAAAGWDWAAVLVLFFLTSTVLGSLTERAGASPDPIAAKGGERDAWQVLANGGVIALAAVVWLVTHDPVTRVAAAGAAAAAAADTWATEIGLAFGGRPRSLLTLRPVERGTSGGVTVLGLLAAVAGAAMIGGVTVLAGWGTRVAFAAGVGGLCGSIADSVLGATVQERRHCAQCDMATERPVHACGQATTIVGGVAGLNNDWVNALSCALGAAVAVLAAR